ncbi:sugar transferase [Telluribacter sp. SYSU D00476]|uniref:sugar transferase n=1 Tax=Telluribacter sp. SYSU D00476 TaxID=2811430 RepID=UPI001FF68EE2|nr:sugar transferase [Telluribacter sp. SYSU D00476]
MYRAFGKRLLDTTAAAAGLMVLSPLLLLLTLLLWLANRGSPFFRQPRPGLHERVFTLVKFKTMNDRRDASGQLLPDGERLTPVGRFIRKTSLDELPQLWNVLRGDMSLIGPRPLLVEYLPLYNEQQRRRHQVRPGITGWAQVNGRNTISWTQKFEYDIWYVDNLSLGLDLKIISLTIWKTLRREGISSATSVTMEKFEGN